MKNASLILNVILLLAVGYLFVAHFSGAKQEPAADVAASDPAGPLHIVYINTDSLLSNYDYFKERQQQLSAKEEQATSNLQARTQALEREFNAANQRAQTGTLAPKEIQQMEQDLMAKRQRLLEEQQRVSQELLQQGQELQEELQNKVKDLLAQLRKEKGYDYILSYGPGTGVLMVNDSLDITSEVLERLNQKKTETAPGN